MQYGHQLIDKATPHKSRYQYQTETRTMKRWMDSHMKLLQSNFESDVNNHIQVKLH